jgi:hypothetical protein
MILFKEIFQKETNRNKGRGFVLKRISYFKTMNKLTTLDWVAIVLVIIGGLNWLLVGFFGWDLVAAIFGTMSIVARLIYVLVGLAAIWLLVVCGKLTKK